MVQREERLQAVPQWALDKGFKGIPWAPDIIYHDGLWYLYYSCSGFGKNKSAIGVTTNRTLNPKSPDFKWEDESLTRIAEPQEWYPVVRRPKGTAPDTVSSDTAVSPDPRGRDFDAGNGAVEAPFIYKHGEYYYLFVSFDLCCRGPLSTYNVVVGRSKCVHGPYYGKDGVPMMEGGGTPVIKPEGKYSGVGHCAIIPAEGVDYIYCHAYSREYNYASKLIVRKLEWSEDGWPTAGLYL